MKFWRCSWQRSRWTSTVESLIARCRPTTVLLAISFVVVDPIQRHPGRAIAHVGIEVHKFHPAVTDGYSTTTVIFPVLVFWICTPLNHSGPNRIDSGVGQSMLESASCTGRFATRLRAAGSQITSAALLHATTVATTMPIRLPILRINSERMRNNKRTESLASKIDGNAAHISL